MNLLNANTAIKKRSHAELSVPQKQEIIDYKKKLTHVELEYFDPNVTSHIQPLYMGIIRSFKAHYRKALVRQ